MQDSQFNRISNFIWSVADDVLINMLRCSPELYKAFLKNESLRWCLRHMSFSVTSIR